MEYYPELINISKRCDEIEALIKPLAIKKSINLKINIEPDDFIFYADKMKMKQIMYNLLSNAIKFTPENGNVDANVKLIDNNFQISESDSGIGIAKKNQEKIFDPFKQLDSSNNRKFGGTGLELAITKKFVEMHGGNIKVESEVGKGSTFIVTIPIDNNISGTCEQ